VSAFIQRLLSFYNPQLGLVGGPCFGFFSGFNCNFTDSYDTDAFWNWEVGITNGDPNVVLGLGNVSFAWPSAGSPIIGSLQLAPNTTFTIDISVEDLPETSNQWMFQANTSGLGVGVPPIGIDTAITESNTTRNAGDCTFSFSNNNPFNQFFNPTCTNVTPFSTNLVESNQPLAAGDIVSGVGSQLAFALNEGILPGTIIPDGGDRRTIVFPPSIFNSLESFNTTIPFSVQSGNIGILEPGSGLISDLFHFANNGDGTSFVAFASDPPGCPNSAFNNAIQGCEIPAIFLPNLITTTVGLGFDCPVSNTALSRCVRYISRGERRSPLDYRCTSFVSKLLYMSTPTTRF
jgi:hypothetical protein